ncbi:MAG: PAS domain S-box protein [Candidatus Bipolaricaulia bacterium]
MGRTKESTPQDVSFSKLAETNPAAITKLNKEGRIIYANKKAEEVLSLEESEKTNRTYDDSAWKVIDFEGNEFPKEELPFQRVKNIGEPVSDVKHAVEWPNGKRKYLSVSASPLFDNDGNFDGVLAVLEDITEREQLKYDLETSEKRYRRLFETAQDGMLILEADTGKIIDANPYIRDLLRFSKEELVGKQLWEIGTFRDVVENKEKFQELVEEGYIRYEHLPLKTKNEEEAPVEFVSNTYMVDGEKVVQCNIRDITERKKAEAELEEKEKEMSILFSNLPGMAFKCENDGKSTMRFVSQGSKKLTGYSPEELIDSAQVSYRELIVKEDRERTRNEVLQAFDSDQPFELEYRIKTKEGKEKHVWERGRGVYTDEGELENLQGFISDITERKKMENQIRHDKQDLRQSFVKLAETTSRVLGVRDPYTKKHELRVGELAREVGERMGLGEDKLLGLYIGGVLHDIGKIVVPETILTKPGDLKDVEWQMIKSHPTVGYDQILEDTDFPWPVAEMTLHHHERLDGSGYPDGLTEEELSKEVRILAVVDVVEAMSTRRPYREARSKVKTLRVIKDGKGKKFDPEVVEVLIEMIEENVIDFG